MAHTQETDVGWESNGEGKIPEQPESPNGVLEFVDALLELIDQEGEAGGSDALAFLWEVMRDLVSIYAERAIVEVDGRSCIVTKHHEDALGCEPHIILRAREFDTMQYTLQIDNLDMRDSESREFGKRTMPYGLYKGRRVDDVPLKYLEWLTKQTFLEPNRILAYFRSPRIAKERAEEPNRRRGEYCEDDD